MMESIVGVGMTHKRLKEDQDQDPKGGSVFAYMTVVHGISRR